MFLVLQIVQVQCQLRNAKLKYWKANLSYVFCLSNLAPDLPNNPAQVSGMKNSALNFGAKSAYSKFGG